tara:strand:+ start:490 stop:708 length:219 start_codon:yes stop_codon:yes gene_type:complete
MIFMTGNLVYYVGGPDWNPYGFTKDARVYGDGRVGIVVRVDVNVYHTYSVYWFKDALISKHVANHLDLVYNV